MTIPKGAKWISRTLFESPYCIGLCITKEQYTREMKRLKVEERLWEEWVTDGYEATVHCLQNKENGQLVAMVCIDVASKLPTPNDICGILIHEAVHIWQYICKHLGENNKEEFEAYMIQTISVRLFSAYSEMMQEEEKKKVGAEQKEQKGKLKS